MNIFLNEDEQIALGILAYREKRTAKHHAAWIVTNDLHRCGLLQATSAQGVPTSILDDLTQHPHGAELT